MVITSKDSDWSDIDRTEWLNDSLCKQNHTIPNLEYEKLKLSNFAVNHFRTKPITALFNTGATCSWISQQIFRKICDKVNMMKKPLKVNTASGATLGPIGIAPLELNMDDQNFAQNSVVYTKLKHHLILGLDFAQRYRIGIDLDKYGKLFLICECKKIATSMKTNNPEQWTIASLEIPAGKQHKTNQKLHLLTNIQSLYHPITFL